MTFADAVARVTAKKVEKHRKLQAKLYATEGLEAGVNAAPGPGNSSTSTGRARSSTRVGGGKPPSYDPGKRSVYKKPGRAAALRGIRNRKDMEPVYIAMGVDYREEVEEKYGVIEAAAKAGEAALKRERKKLIRLANRRQGAPIVVDA